jgi:hypothetical protein
MDSNTHKKILEERQRSKNKRKGEMKSSSFEGEDNNAFAILDQRPNENKTMHIKREKFDEDGLTANLMVLKDLDFKLFHNS